MKKILKKEILGLFLLLFGLLIFISIVGYNTTEQPSGLDGPPDSILSYFGVYVGYAHYFIMGYCSLSIPIILSVIGYLLFANKSLKKYYQIIIYIFVFSLWLATILSYFDYDEISGLLGVSIATFLNDIFGSFGSGAIMFVLFVFLLILVFKISVYENLSNFVKSLFQESKSLFNKLLTLFKKILTSFKKIFKKETKTQSSTEAPAKESSDSEEQPIIEVEDTKVDENQKEESENNFDSAWTENGKKETGDDSYIGF